MAKVLVITSTFSFQWIPTLIYTLPRTNSPQYKVISKPVDSFSSFSRIPSKIPVPSPEIPFLPK